MKRFAALLLSLCLFALPTLAQAAEPLSGERLYPDGATADTAVYVLRYAYPQVDVSDEADKAINDYFAALCDDMANVVIPQTVEALDTQPDEGMPPLSTELAYSIMVDNADYLSVLMTASNRESSGESESWSAVTFARSGVYDGQPLELSQVIGLEDEDTTSSVSFVAQLAYRLVWQIITEQQSMNLYDFLPDLTQEDLMSVFTPETDFYLDSDGNFVFFVQAGLIASEVDGPLIYPFTTAELLSAVKE